MSAAIPAQSGPATAPRPGRPVSTTGDGAIASTRLWHRGYLALLTTQFLGAFNDNLFKVIVSLIAVGTAAGPGTGGGPLSLATIVMIVPYLLFSGYAGYLADVYPKRTMIILVKLAELALTGLIVVSFVLEGVGLMIGLLFLMAAQSTFFLPLKYGVLPEIVARKDLARANGSMELGRYLAIIMGTGLGGLLLAVFGGATVPLALVLVGIAGVGLAASVFIPCAPGKLRSSDFALNPFSELGRGLKRLKDSRMIATAVLGLMCFDFTSVLVFLDILLLGSEVMALGPAEIGALGAVTGLGTGFGCLLAGWICRSTLRPALAPPAALAVSVLLLGLAAAPISYPLTAGFLFGGGICGGLLFVPLNAVLQTRAESDERGLILATCGWLTMAGVLVAAGLVWGLHDLALVPPIAILRWAALPLTLFALTAIVMQPAFRPGKITLAGALRRAPTSG